MRDSIFYSSIKTLFMTLFGMIGVGLGLIPLMLILGLSLSGSTADTKLKSAFDFEIAPNGKGIRKELGKDAPVILKLNINGVIGTEKLNMQTIRTQLIESREGLYKNNRVKAILLYINSPGGTVVDSDGIYRAINEYKETHKVPVFAFVDGLCASGGMYVASAADKIYATNVSLIGSVGVLSPSFMNFTKLIDKLGVEALTLTAGKDKDELNPLRPWKEGEGDNIKKIIETYYTDFVDIVLAARKSMTRKNLVDDYGAKVFPAPTALEYGYVDFIDKSQNEVTTLLAKEMGVEDDFYQVIQPEEKSWLATLFKSQSTVFKGVVHHRFELGSQFIPELQNQFLYLYQP